MSGMAARSEGNIPGAIRLYEASFTLDPQDLTTLGALGELYIRQKRWGPYITRFREALEHQPNDPFLLERLGSMLVTCPDPDFRNTQEGREYSERAFIHKSSTSMTVVSAGRSLALAYATLGDKQNAGFVIQRTIQAARSIPVSPSNLQELERLAGQIGTLPG
jgi:tetratricopeptide (TPR) repeat protein